MQHSQGVPSRELTPAEALEIVPQLELDGVLAATFCPRDGHMSPEAVVQGYAAAAVARGAQVLQGCPATGIEHAGGRITGVRTARGHDRDRHRRVRGGRVVERGRRDGRPRHPGARRAAPHVVLARARRPARRPAADDRLHDELLLPRARGRASSSADARSSSRTSPSTRCERLPLILELPIQSSWWGYYEVSPDHNAIVGESPGTGRFLYATGFSGHGFQQSPGDRRAPGAARAWRAADVRPERLRRSSASPAASSAPSASSSEARSAKPRKRMTGRPPFRPLHRRTDSRRNLYLGGASTYFGDARCATERM